MNFKPRNLCSTSRLYNVCFIHHLGGSRKGQLYIEESGLRVNGEEKLGICNILAGEGTRFDRDRFVHFMYSYTNKDRDFIRRAMSGSGNIEIRCFPVKKRRY